jgi:hypothetical protein
VAPRGSLTLPEPAAHAWYVDSRGCSVLGIPLGLFVVLIVALAACASPPAPTASPVAIASTPLSAPTTRPTVGPALTHTLTCPPIPPDTIDLDPCLDHTPELVETVLPAQETLLPAESPSCAPSSLSPLHDDGHVKVEDMLSHTPRRSLRAAGEEVASVEAAKLEYDGSFEALEPAMPANLPLALIMYEPAADTYILVYSNAEVGDETTVGEVIASGGIVAVEQAKGETDGQVAFDATDRNRWMVDIGGQDAALIWGDEVAAGTRPFGLYWTDDERSWIVNGTPGDPDALVDFARSIYCRSAG